MADVPSRQVPTWDDPDVLLVRERIRDHGGTHVMGPQEAAQHAVLALREAGRLTWVADLATVANGPSPTTSNTTIDPQGDSA